MSSAVIGSKYDDDSDENQPCINKPGREAQTVKVVEPARQQWMPIVMGLNLVLTIGILVSQSGHTAASASMANVDGNSLKGNTLLLEGLDSVKASMVSKNELDAMMHSILSRMPREAQAKGGQDAADGQKNDTGALGSELEEQKAIVSQLKEELKAKESELAAASSGAAAAPTSAGVVTNPDFAQVLIYKGKVDVGKKGQTHSQFGQDWFVSSVLGCKRNGFFIDLAANDFMVLSNTLMLERDFGWQGLCLEANSQYIYGLAKRQCKTTIAAIGAPKNEKVTFALRGDKGGIAGRGPNAKNKGGEMVDMHLVTFDEVLKTLQAPPKIDFMSLDVEGAEDIVMQTFPWDKHTISLLTIERPKKELKDKMESKGYQMLRGNHNGDEFWIHKSFPDFDNVYRKWGKRGTPLPESTCMDDLKYERPTSLS